MLSRIFLPLLLALLSVQVQALGATDMTRDADSTQSGYLWAHNIDPAVVGSSAFKILWKIPHNVNERFYAKPLVYTPTGGKQMVFIASNQNIIRTVDAVTGQLIRIRHLQPPFLASDSGCGDIPNTVGITGTPIIDPSTNIVYLFSKGYMHGASSGGVANARFLMYAIDITTFVNVPGFPVLIDGHHAVNDPKKYFVAGNVNQRPSLITKGNTVIAGFGSVCDFFNYTGMLVGVSKVPHVGVTQIYAMEGGPGATPESNDLLHGNGGEAGIWQGGMGISTDGADRIFFATGNGRGDSNKTPQTGFGPLSTLDDVVARFAVSSTGTFTLRNYFEPADYTNLDAVDQDLGSSGFSLLDTTTFQGSGVLRMGVVAGKMSRMYILDANNLGGFKMGPGGGDHAVQVITLSGPVWGGTGSYPLEGGYIYVTPKGQKTAAYKFQGGGVAHFTLAGQTAMAAANSVGIGTPTITSFKNTPGTGILWICDPAAGLRAFKAVPVGGVLQQITTPATGRCNKFARPAFGDGRVYVTDFDGNLYGMGV